MLLSYIFSVNYVIKDDTKIFCGFDPRVLFEFTIILTFLTINEEMLIFFRGKNDMQGHFLKQVMRRWPIYCFCGFNSLGESWSKGILMKCLANQNWKKKSASLFNIVELTKP